MLNSRNVKAQPTIDYFQNDAGNWQGAGAEKLGLRGEIDKSDFARVLRGWHPRLNERIFDKRVTRSGVDCTFSCSKSISIAALVEGDVAVIAAHNAAVARSIDFIEQRYSTVKYRGTNYTAGNSIVAKFCHGDNRLREPHLHSHCIFINAIFYENKWRALRNDGIYFNAKTIGLVYQQYLALNLENIGYKVDFTSNGYANAAIREPEQIHRYCRRRDNVLAAASSQDWKSRQRALLKTRPLKQKDAEYSIPFALPNSIPQAVQPVPLNLELLKGAWQECARKYFKFDREKLETEVLKRAGRTCDLESLFKATQQLLPLIDSFSSQKRESLQKIISSPSISLPDSDLTDCPIITATLASKDRCLVWESKNHRCRQRYLDLLLKALPPSQIAVLESQHPQCRDNRAKAKLWVVLQADRLLADRLTNIIGRAATEGAKVLFISANLPSQLK